MPSSAVHAAATVFGAPYEPPAGTIDTNHLAALAPFRPMWEACPLGADEDEARGPLAAAPETLPAKPITAMPRSA